MGPYKLIALDMDGTLLDHKRYISVENKKWIQKALEVGITVSFSTGREIQSVLPYVEELKLHTPIVTANGSEVWEKPDVLHSRHLIDAKWIDKLHKLANEYDAWYWAHSVQGMFNKDNQHVTNDWPEDLDSIQWLKFGFYTDHDNNRKKILEIMNEWDIFEITNSHPHNLECNAKGISKASGLREVCQLLGIQMSEVVAMGDSLNDVTMIREAGLGVAMGNAQESVKEIADIVTVTNDEHGVAKVIEQYVLGEG